MPQPQAHGFRAPRVELPFDHLARLLPAPTPQGRR